MMHEMEHYKASTFATLTYDNDHLPLGGDLVKAHLQGYIKRVRYALSKDKRVMRYYACGEYGTLYGRPHYHAILFGLGPEDRDLLEDNWDNGNIYCGTVSLASIQYVAGYIMDKWASKSSNVSGVHHDKRPFAIMSKGIGYDWMRQHENELLSDMSITLHGHRQSIPRSYMRKLEDVITEDYRTMWADAMDAETRGKLIERGVDDAEVRSYQYAQRQQRKEGLKWQQEAHKRSKL